MRPQKSCLITDFDGDIDDLFMLYADMVNIGYPPLYMILSDDVADRITKEAPSISHAGSAFVRASDIDTSDDSTVWINRVGLVFPEPDMRFDDLGGLNHDRWRRLEMVHGLWPDRPADPQAWRPFTPEQPEQEEFEFYGQRD